MTEKAKRLAPKGETLRELFLKSGNLCAFPGCTALMMDSKGTFVGQVCHIEAAEEEGERFNPEMTNEERRNVSNLMLMCYAHHQKTNDVNTYTAAKLRQMKKDHEGRFSNPDRAILEALKDWTEVDIPTPVQNLQRLNEALNWKLGPQELQVSVQELNAYIDKLRNVPINQRRFVGAVARRAEKMRRTGVVKEVGSGVCILVSDIKLALKMGDDLIAEYVSMLNGYGLCDIAEIDTELGLKPAIRILNLPSGWPLWSDIVSFCEIKIEPLEVFTENLDFSRLDIIPNAPV